MADTTGNDYGTIIGVDATFKGDLVFESAAKVLGKVEGSIQSKDRIHIADGSACKAKISAKEIAVEGEVEGNVEASERVELKPGARVTGDIVAARMTMSDGAALDGHVRIGMGDSADGRARSTAETKPAASSTSSEQHDGSRGGSGSGGGQQTAKSKS